MPRPIEDIEEAFERFFALLEARDTTGLTGINGSIGPSGYGTIEVNSYSSGHSGSSGTYYEFSGSPSCEWAGTPVCIDPVRTVKKKEIFKPLSEVKKFGIVDFCNKYYK